MHAIRRFLTRSLEILLIAAVAMLVLDVVWGVFTRYVLNEQAKWSEELARFLLIWVSLLGGALAFSSKEHLGVDYFVGKLDAEARRGMALFTHGVVLFFASAIFVYGGARVVIDALTLEQTTPALGWKMGYVYLALPISGLFMMLFTVDNFLETLRHREPTDEGQH